MITDGPCYLKAIHTHINPSTKVGISNVKAQIENATLKQFNHNIVLDNMQLNEWYQEVITAQKDYDEDMLRHLFKIYKGSYCEDFRSHIVPYQSKWEQGDATKVEDVMNLALTKYNNLIAQTEWVSKDPPSVKVLALFSKALKQGKCTSADDKKTTTSSGIERDPRYKDHPDWKFSKTMGDHCNKDGKEWWWWCKYHNNGKGMYMRHTQESHQKRIDKVKAEKCDESDSSKDKNKNKNKTGSNFKLTDELKASLCNICSEADAMSLLTQLGAVNSEN